jgi:hypothetical protein
MPRIGLTNQAEPGPSVAADALKIDGAATDGLTGTANSLAYRVHEIERHFHSRERWFGKKAVQTATDWADDTLNPYVAISGNNAYGTDANDAALVFGTDDTPVIAGSAKFDLSQINVVNSNSTSPWKLRIIYGTGTMADAITAGQYSCTMVQVASAAGRMGTTPVRMPRCANDTQVWVQAWNATDNATISFFVAMHEYDG